LEYSPTSDKLDEFKAIVGKKVEEVKERMEMQDVQLVELIS
jgi:hypothetical protein